MKHASDIRWRSVVATLVAVLATGILVQQLPGMRENPAYTDATTREVSPGQWQLNTTANTRDNEVDLHFQQAALMLHAHQYEYAIAALQKTLELAPGMPEAYVNMGYALLGLEKHEAAGQYFSTAIDLRPAQANAYWGLAVSLEQSGDYDAAIGAMRTYIHLSEPADPFLKKARAAVWEWDEARKKITLNEND